MNKEQWKNITGYKDYQISDKGRVRSLKGKSNRVMKQRMDKRGYYRINLSEKGNQKTFKIHQLVAIEFLNHIPSGMDIIVDHRDNNRFNNSLENLQLITQRENTSKDQLGHTSKYIGVCWDKRSKKWVSKIHLDGKQKFLGSFDNEIDAHNAYQRKLIKNK